MHPHEDIQENTPTCELSIDMACQMKLLPSQDVADVVRRVFVSSVVGNAFLSKRIEQRLTDRHSERSQCPRHVGNVVLFQSLESVGPGGFF